MQGSTLSRLARLLRALAESKPYGVAVLFEPRPDSESEGLSRAPSNPRTSFESE